MSDIELVCFDLDNTLINEHSHSILSRRGVKPITSKNGLVVNGKVATEGNKDYKAQSVQEEIQKLLDENQITIKNQPELLQIFQDFLKRETNITITSFNLYPDAVSPILKKIGLTEEEVKKIQVVTGFPPNGPSDSNRKKYHIEKAMELSGVVEKGKVLLIDDDAKNIDQAKEMGAQAVLVPKDVTEDKKYLLEIRGAADLAPPRPPKSNVQAQDTVQTKPLNLDLPLIKQNLQKLYPDNDDIVSVKLKALDLVLKSAIVQENGSIKISVEGDQKGIKSLLQECGGNVSVKQNTLIFQPPITFEKKLVQMAGEKIKDSDVQATIVSIKLLAKQSASGGKIDKFLQQFSDLTGTSFDEMQKITQNYIKTNEEATPKKTNVVSSAIKKIKGGLSK